MGLVDSSADDQVLVHPHLGLGDALVINALVRDLAAKHSLITVLCKPHNRFTEEFMWRDVQNLDLFTVENDDEANRAKAEVERYGFKSIGLGFWGPQPFDRQQWDREFYRQSGVDFQQRWNAFSVVRQPSRELKVPSEPFVLIHENREKGWMIDRSKLPKLPVVEVLPTTGNLFDYWGTVEQATELHLMESCVAILADSLPQLKARRRCIHAYCRESIAPTYQGSWEVLR